MKSQFLLPFYESLLTRLDNHGDLIKESSIADDHKKVLKYVYTSTQNTIFQLRHNYDTNFVVNINSYLEIVSENVDTLNGLNADKNVLAVIDNYKKDYAAGFDEKIIEALDLISSQITPAVDDIQVKLHDETLNLLQEIEEMKNSTLENRNKLQQQRAKLKNKVGLKVMLGSLKLIGTAISCLGPQGAAVGAIISGGASMSESVFLDSSKADKEFAKVKADVLKNQQLIQSNLKAWKDEKNKMFNQMIDDVLQEIEPYSDNSLKNLTQFVTNVRNEYNAKKDDIYYDDSELRKKLAEEIAKEISQLEETYFGGVRNTNNENKNEILDKLKKCDQIIDIASKQLEVYKDINKETNKINEMDAAIKAAEETLKALQQKTQDVYNILFPMLQNIQKDTEKQIKDLENKSLVALDVGRLQVQQSLKKTLKLLSSFTQGFEVEEEFISLIDDLKEAMMTVINIFDRIQNYQDQQALGNYIADINSAHIQGITITDVALNSAYRDLEISIRSGVILQQYNLAIAAFKHWVFPLAENYLVEFKPPKTEGFESNNTDILVSDISNQITKIRRKVKEYNSLITENEAHIMNGDFNSELVSSKPFCVWKNANSRAMIKKLLSGEEISISANINLYNKDAIKFNFAEFNFKAINQSLQAELVQNQKAFKISTTHMGNSHFRFNGNFYAITSTKLEIVYSFEKLANGVPAFKNDVYVKLKAGDIILSPYTNWKVKLTKATENISFDVLEKFKDKVDLEIIGAGKYIEPYKIKVDVDSYYKTINGYN